MGVLVGEEAVKHARKVNEERAKQADSQTSTASKQNRIVARNARITNDYMFEQSEGIVYGAGI